MALPPARRIAIAVSVDSVWLVAAIAVIAVSGRAARQFQISHFVSFCPRASAAVACCRPAAIARYSRIPDTDRGERSV